MDQLHLLFEDDGIFALDIYLKTLDFLKGQDININYEESKNIIQTYYDGLGMFIYKNGGFLRKTGEVDDNQNYVGLIDYEFRPIVRSHTRKVQDAMHLDRNSLVKIFSINTKLFKEFKFFANHNFMNFNLNNSDDEYSSHFNFVVDSGILQDYDGVSKPVTIFSLSDATMNKYNQFIANLNKEETEKFISKYSKFMKQFKLKKISASKYQEMKDVLDKEKQRLLDTQEKTEE